MRDLTITFCFIVGIVLLYSLFINKKSFVRYRIFLMRMGRVYAKALSHGCKHTFALEIVSDARHPEISPRARDTLISKFSQLQPLLEFIFWGIEVHLPTKSDCEDEKAVLAVIEAGKVLVKNGQCRVVVDKDAMRSYYNVLTERLSEASPVDPIPSLDMDSTSADAYRKTGMTALIILLDKAGVEHTGEDLLILEMDQGNSGLYEKRLEEFRKGLIRGFFACAAQGVIFLPEEKILLAFGKTVEQNYPEAGKSFIKFAKTYWTLKLVRDDLLDHDAGWLGATLLSEIEQFIAPVFFPMPGPSTGLPADREHTQRKLLNQFAPNIDIEDFIQKNPILIRDKSKGTACLDQLDRHTIHLEFKDTVDTQIDGYVQLKKNYPNETEINILNSLLLIILPINWAQNKAFLR